MTWWPFSTARRVEPKLSSSNVLAGYAAIHSGAVPRRSQIEQLTAAIHEAEALRRTIANLEAINEAVCIERDELREDRLFWKDAAFKYQNRCRQIIALETPNMAHVGKKAVAIARGGDGA